MKNKMKTSKKLLAIVLTAIMMLSVCAVLPAMAADPPTVTRIIFKDFNPTTTAYPGDELIVVLNCSEAPQDSDSGYLYDSLLDSGNWSTSIISIMPADSILLNVTDQTDPEEAPNPYVFVSWLGDPPIEAGETVRVQYQITVPDDAAGVYDFDGNFSTPVGGEIDIGGDGNVTVETPDEEPPAAISDLATSNPTPSSIDLTWTAPGDDGDTGTAAEYDIRYLEGTTPITDANWASATEYVGEPAPQPAGSSETFTVTGLSADTTYYFAIKTADEVPNWSPVSNSPYGTTTTELQQFDLSLVVGWNLISIPLEPADTSLNAGFPDASDGDLFETYDGGWLVSTYYSAIPGWVGDIEDIELDKGYWYNANTAYTATIEGTEAGPRSVPINAGWNLIGYARLTEAGLNDLIPNANDGDLLEAYDGGWLVSTYYSAIPGWVGDFDTIQAGNGYWYQANDPFTWEY